MELQEYIADFNKNFTLRELKGEALTEKEMDNNFAIAASLLNIISKYLFNTDIEKIDANNDKKISIGEMMNVPLTFIKEVDSVDNISDRYCSVFTQFFDKSTKKTLTYSNSEKIIYDAMGTVVKDLNA